MSSHEKLIWRVFYLLLIVIFIKVIGRVIGLSLDENKWFEILFLGLPLVLLVLHSLFTLSTFRALFFLILASSTGWIAEVWGLNAGTFFGGHYIYKSQQTAILSIPLAVILYWAAFIYTGYSIVNSFFYWLNKQKPNIKQKNLWVLVAAILLDGWIVVAIDLFMDPLQVKGGNWQWLEAGPFFGVPTGNFIGWFTVTIIVTGIFRSLEYFFPAKEEKYDKAIFIIPVIGYGALAIYFAIHAVMFQMPDLAVIGCLLMFPTFIINLFLFRKWKMGKA